MYELESEQEISGQDHSGFNYVRGQVAENKGKMYWIDEDYPYKTRLMSFDFKSKVLTQEPTVISVN